MPQYIVLPTTATLLPQDVGAADGANGVITRFAPSPNGSLHLGHAYAAICAHDFAGAHGGRFLLRIEDIDGTRSRAEHIDGIIADLKWLGLSWDREVIFQSARVESYKAALGKLQAMGLVYRCNCTRSEIAEVIAKSPVPHGPDGPVYPGTCRPEKGQKQDIDPAAPHCWRLDMTAAIQRAGLIRWTDLAAGEQIADPALFGDVVLWRKDAPASYHLAATLDDAADGVSHVVRGKDLFAYTAVHVLLQKLLGLLQPLYWHHELLLDENREKLAKSAASAALATRRAADEDGKKLAQMIREGQLPLGISLSSA